MIKAIFLILVTIFIPPLGVFAIAGCGMDLLINILLTILGYLPGHIHAFYLEYIFFQRRDQARAGMLDSATPRAPGVYSERIQRGGKKHLRGGVVQQQYQGPVVGTPYTHTQPPPPPPPAPPVQQGYPVAGGPGMQQQPQTQAGYGGQSQYGTV